MIAKLGDGTSPVCPSAAMTAWAELQALTVQFGGVALPYPDRGVV